MSARQQQAEALRVATEKARRDSREALAAERRRVAELASKQAAEAQSPPSSEPPEIVKRQAITTKTVTKQKPQGGIRKFMASPKSVNTLAKNFAVINKFLLDDATVKTSNAKNTLIFQQKQLDRVINDFTRNAKERDLYTKESFEEYNDQVHKYITAAGDNVENIKEFIVKGKLTKQNLRTHIKKLEKVAATPPVITFVKKKKDKTVPISETISQQKELSPLGKISQQYEKQFKKVETKITDLINKNKAKSLALASKGKVAPAGGALSVSLIGNAGRGVFNAVTFPVRPVQWKKMANSVAMLLTPLEGESQSNYEKRINQFVGGDLLDPEERKRAISQVLSVMPVPPSGTTKEQRETAAIYQAAIAETIMSDPVAFLVETAGGLAGGYVAGKIIARLPASIRKLTPKTLEQRAFEKLHPLETIDEITGTGEALKINKLPSGKKITGLSDGFVDDAAQIQDAIGAKGHLSLGKGSWGNANRHWTPKARRGTTTLIVLVDPISKVVKGILTMQEAREITGGIPELLTTMGGLQAIPVVRVDQDVSLQTLKEINRLYNQTPILIPKSALKNLNKNDEILKTLLSQGVIVIPDLDKNLISTSTQKLITEQEISLMQAQALDIKHFPVLEDPTIIQPETPKLFLRKKDKEKRIKLNLRLFRGAKSMFKVTFFFTKSISEVITVEARSFVEAVNKAQRGRKRRKKQPSLVDVVKTR